MLSVSQTAETTSARSSLAWSAQPQSRPQPASQPIPTRAPSGGMVDVAIQTEPVDSVALAGSRLAIDPTSYPHYVSHHATRYVSYSELPNEIWGEIASFSSKKDILNLRTVSSDIRMQADTMITELTLCGGQALIDFAYSDGFKHIKTLHLYQIDKTALNLFTNRLTTHPHENLVIELAEGQVGLSDALSGLSALPLRGLRLDGVYVTPEVVGALAESTFPITLSGYMTQEELENASRLPTLINLSVRSAQLSDDVALSFSAHPALQHLTFSVNQNFSSQGLEYLAGIPSLHVLKLYDTVFMANAISTTAMRQLAAHRTLERLSIQTRIDPLSDACLSALSFSATLKSLAISLCPGIHHVTRMALLEHLQLNARCVGTRRMDVPTAHLIGEMPSLKTLELDFVAFEANAFRTLIWHLRAETLQLANISVEEDGVVALLANGRLKALSLVDVRIAPEHAVALCQHERLLRLTINGVACLLSAVR